MPSNLSDLLVMRLSDSSYRRWRAVHVWSGAIPVAAFLVCHFAVNAVAILGPDAFNRVSTRLDRLPFVAAFEVLGIALPILFHIVLGILLGNTAQAMEDVECYPRPWMRFVQRATGAYLLVYVVFHVWGTRLSPDLLVKRRDLFSILSAQLQHPAMRVFYVGGVLAAAAHVGLGWIGAAGVARRPGAPPVGRGWARLALATFVVLAAIGTNAVLAFVSRPARWLEPAALVPHVSTQTAERHAP